MIPRYRLWLAATFVSVTLFVAGFAALYLYAQSEYRAVRRANGSWFRGDRLFVSDPEIGFGPNREGLTLLHVRGTGRFVEVSTNSQGLRVPPDQRRAAMTGADVVTVGCSFTFGHGVEAEEAYPAVAGEISGLRVANGAFSAYSSVGALIALERLSALHPAVVVYGVIDAHLHRNLSPCAPSGLPICRSQAYVAFTAQGPEIRSPANGDWGERLTERLLADLDAPEGSGDGWRGLALVAGAALSKVMAPRPDNSAERQEAAMAFLLQRMEAVTDAMGARLVVVHLPQAMPLDGEPFQAVRPPEALIRALPPGVEMIDETGTVATIPPGQSLRLSPLDSHPTAIVHRAMGEDLGRRLKALRRLQPPAASNASTTASRISP